MAISKLATYTNLTKNHSNGRVCPITKITIHHMAGIMTGKSCADYFASTSRQVSSNYCIGYDGDIACSVDESNRSWCSCSYDNDNRAITIEVSNDNTKTYSVSEKSMKALIELCVDICKRNNIKKLNFTGNKDGNLTMHCYFADTYCPGDYLGSRFPYIAETVNARLAESQSSSPTTSPSKPSTSTPDNSGIKLNAGDKLNLKSVPLYVSSTAMSKSATRSGLYYIWSPSISNNRIRITNSSDRVGQSGQVTGWISVADAKDSLVNKVVNYLVRVKSTLNIRKGPGTNYATNGTAKPGAYTIVEECVGSGSSKGWGKLKSGAGWISLDSCTKV